MDRGGEACRGGGEGLVRIVALKGQGGARFVAWNGKSWYGSSQWSDERRFGMACLCGTHVGIGKARIEMACRSERTGLVRTVSGEGWFGTARHIGKVGEGLSLGEVRTRFNLA